MKGKTVVSFSGLVLVVLLVVFVNILAGVGLRGARIDLTENQLYTLTEGSRSIVGSLDEPVTFKLYVSSLISTVSPEFKPYIDRVRELLGEYEAASDGMLTVKEIDPEPSSAAEDEAVGAGLQGRIANAAGDLAFFGLVASNSTDDRRVIPFLDPSREEQLEYDFSRLIHELSNPERPVLGLMTGLPMRGAPSPFPGQPATPTWAILGQLQGLFEMRDVSPFATEIDDDIDVLMVVHPKDLLEETLRALDAFVLGGGRALVFLDPHSEEDRPPPDPNNPMAALIAPRGSDLEPLLEAWGARLRPDVLAGDLELALQVTAGTPDRPEPVKYLVWMQPGPDQLSKSDVVTAGLDTLRMPTAGILDPVEGAGTTFEPLIVTTGQSTEIPVQTVQFMTDPAALVADFQPGGTPLVLAARLSGPATSAYADDPPDTDDDEGSADADGGGSGPAPTSGEINVIVVADVDMLADRYWLQFIGPRAAVPLVDNGDFVINALDNLSGSEDLIAIRSRGSFRRPFESIEQMRREAEREYLAEAQKLETRLAETEQRLTELQRQRADGSSLLLTPEQSEAIARFRAEQVATRKELREVRHQLRKDIDAHQTRLQWINVLVAPLAIVLLMALAAWAAGRRAAGRTAA